MGVANAENSDTAADMTTAKPRERQFQVVPVPGKFTRGRWQCWDYRDDKPDVSEKILDFTDKSEKNVAPSTIAVSAEAQSNTNTTSNATSQLSADCTSAAHPVIDQPHSILKAQQQPGGSAVANAANTIQKQSSQADISSLATTNTNIAHKESSTIVVTSIAPAPVTPVHRTSSSSIDMDETTNIPDNTDNIANIQVPSTVTIVSEEDTDLDHEPCESSRRSSSSSQSSETTETKSTKSCSTTISIPVGNVTLADNVDSSQYCSVSPSLPAVPANSFVSPSLISTIHHSSSLQRECAFQSATDAELSRQTSVASFHDGSMNSNPATALNKIDATIDDSLATGNLPGGPNVVAIDNKIEQAMDLVKTHLTFAVREEVEILRSTIVELEAKVAQLESQNQVLKQFAPAEIVANLALLVQNAQQQKQMQQLQQQAQIVTLPPVTGTSLAPPVISAAQPIVVNAKPLTAQSDEMQSSVGVMPLPNTSTATDSNSNQITSTSIPSATDITTTSQLSSTLNSMAVNLSSSMSNTNTTAK